MKKLAKAIAVASLASASVMGANVASAEVEYSAQLDSMYLFRGQDQDVGGLISASIDYSHDSGLYAGAWVASAPEYDVYLGYWTELGDLELDLGITSYAYPNAGSGVDSATGLGEEVEAYVSLGFKGASFEYYHGLEALDEATYMAVGYEYENLSAKYGMNDDGFGAEYSHIDVTAGLTDELSLTLSKAMDDSSATADAAVEDLQVLVTYTLPIK
ncbi:TorF family putative porin [Bermanella sp. R86510]|uniref:TorF family putative porin n=1 Tax=unclassified Bermanella TaxID=2627862 RepID=UPI0037CC6CE2